MCVSSPGIFLFQHLVASQQFPLITQDSAMLISEALKSQQIKAGGIELLKDAVAITVLIINMYLYFLLM